MEVPATQTSADRNLEKKRHADEMSVLAAKKEVATRETEQAIEAATLASIRLGEISGKLAALEDTVSDASRETVEFLAHCCRILAQAGATVAEMGQMARTIEHRAAQAIENLAKAEKQAEIVHTTAVAEQARINTAMIDLDIYRSRVEEYFRKYLPDQEIKL